MPFDAVDFGRPRPMWSEPIIHPIVWAILCSIAAWVVIVWGASALIRMVI